MALHVSLCVNFRINFSFFDVSKLKLPYHLSNSSYIHIVTMNLLPLPLCFSLLVYWRLLYHGGSCLDSAAFFLLGLPSCLSSGHLERLRLRRLLESE